MKKNFMLQQNSLTGLPAIEAKAKAETETHPATAEVKISVQYNLKPYKLFYASFSSSY